MDDDDDGGAVRTYNCGMPHCRWMMEDLQWFDASSWMNKWWELTVVWHLIHFLLGGGVITSYISFTGHSVGLLSRGRWSWPGMTCWLQMMTCEHAPPTGDRSTSQWAPRPPSSVLFRQLPEKGPPLRYLCCWLHHIDAFLGEVLAKVDATGVMDWPHHHLHISLCHLSPVLHHEFLQWCDSWPQGVLVIIHQDVAEHVHNAIYLVPVWLGFHWILWSRIGEVIWIIIRDFDDFYLLQSHVDVLESA